MLVASSDSLNFSNRTSAPAPAPTLIPMAIVPTPAIGPTIVTSSPAPTTEGLALGTFSTRIANVRLTSASSSLPG
jgi:hypothetical protein